MLEPSPDNQFIFISFSYLGAIFAFALVFFVFRMLYSIFIKQDTTKYKQNSIVVCLCMALMFASIGLGLNAQFTQAELFSDINYSWGIWAFIGGAVLGGLATLMGYVAIRGGQYVVNLTDSDSKNGQ